MSDYVGVNRANWDSRVPAHLEGYGVEDFVRDPAHLSEVVRYDLERLGDISGLDVVHLQCHIGTDTISLARCGPRSVTGLDFSPAAIEAARRLSAEAGADIDFVEAEVYDALEVLGPERFDLVYTGVGAIGWLPDIRRWAEVVAGLLRPGGRLFIRDCHPVLAAVADSRPDGLLVLEYSYFEDEGVEFFEEFSYVEHSQPLASPAAVCFNHGLGEMITAVLEAGLVLTGFAEHTSAPWNPLGASMQADARGEFSLRERRERLPMTFTLQARRPI